jgi:hypothetical protein
MIINTTDNNNNAVQALLCQKYFEFTSCAIKILTIIHTFCKFLYRRNIHANYVGLK